MAVDARNVGPPTVIDDGGQGQALATAMARGTAIGGDFTLIEPIASGGMGVVYRAREADYRDVAIKLVLPELAGFSHVRALFISESRAITALEHPNIVPVYRVGDDGGRLFIAMRLIRGPSLRDEIERLGKLPAARVAEIGGQVARALHHAHERSLLHRDVKPGNVLLGGTETEETAYLSDFGLSAPAREAGQSAWVGTLPYASPESLLDQAQDERSDLFSLGCVLFEAITGQRPFAGSTPTELKASHREHHPSIAAHLEDHSPAFDAILRRALARRREERFASAAEFAQRLRGVRRDLIVFHQPSLGARAHELCGALRPLGIDAAPHDLSRVSNEQLDGELGYAAACAVVVGRRGLTEWPRRALQRISHRARADRSFRAISVLTPGAPPPNDPRLSYVQSWPWIDLRERAVPTGEELTSLTRDIGLAPGSRPRPDPTSLNVCPYPGLEGFDETHARFFFGREHETHVVVQQLQRLRLAVVVGASGAGKTSLLRAGVVPYLRDRLAWRVMRMRPGADPLANLGAAIGRQIPKGPDASTVLVEALEQLAPPEGRSILIVDQFEELFTQTVQPERRRTIVDALLDAATLPGGNAAILLGMRADFYPRCAEIPQLATAVADHQLLLGPLSSDRLQSAIIEPARRSGLVLDPGLAQSIAEDAGESPGALPLVGHLLRELWESRQGNRLTVAAYASSGGVEGALARAADTALEGLDGDGVPEKARRIFLRLTEPGDGTEDTRRQAELTELARPGDHDSQRILDALIEARLLVVSRESSGETVVDVAHEALIRSWPRLGRWIDEDRQHLREQSRLSSAARDWELSQQSPDLLFRGVRLAYWQEADASNVSDRERAFLAASRAEAERQERARTVRTRRTIGGLAIGLVIVLVAALFALAAERNASAEADRRTAQQIVAIGDSTSARDPERALAMFLEADDVGSAPAIRARIREAAGRLHVRGAASLPGGGPLTRVHLSTSRDGTATIASTLGLHEWSGADVEELPQSRGVTYALAESPTNPDRRLAIETAGGEIIVRSSTVTGDLRLPGQPALVDIGPEARFAAVAQASGAVHLIDTLQSPVARRLKGVSDVSGVAVDRAGNVFSGQGGRIVIHRPDGSLRYQSTDGPWVPRSSRAVPTAVGRHWLWSVGRRTFGLRRGFGRSADGLLDRTRDGYGARS